MKILILKPSSLGDVVQALPVLRLLKRRYPAAAIHWWIESSLVSLLAGDPDLSGVIPFDRQAWRRLSQWPRAWRNLAQVRRHAWDWAIDLQGLFRSGLTTWLANAEFTIGVDDPREGARLFYDRAVPRPSYHTHAVDWYLRVLTALGVPVHWDFDWLPARPQTAESARKKWGELTGSRWIIVQPGARWENKRWPIEHFSAALRALARQFTEVKFAVLGGGSDQPLGRQLSEAVPARCLDLTGQTTLPEMIEWIRHGELMITNDTGPMHVAAALGKPVVGLFGPTEPRRTGPYGKTGHILQTRLACVPCLKPQCRHVRPLECLHSISPADVCAAVAKVL